MGPPPEGEMVQLQWTDGIVCKAKFIAAQISQIYQVNREEFKHPHPHPPPMLDWSFCVLVNEYLVGTKGLLCAVWLFWDLRSLWSYRIYNDNV